MAFIVTEKTGGNDVVLVVVAAITASGKMFRSALKSQCCRLWKAVAISNAFKAYIIEPNGITAVIATAGLFFECVKT
jgi:hypothetical protein